MKQQDNDFYDKMDIFLKRSLIKRKYKPGIENSFLKKCYDRITTNDNISIRTIFFTLQRQLKQHEIYN